MGIADNYEYFWQPEPNSGCWIWLGYLRGGHRSFRPCIQYNQKPTFICTLICEEANGPPPTPKHQAAHKRFCSGGLCINPDHLYWATPAQNVRDMIEVNNAKFNRS